MSKYNPTITVCDKCYRACCWQGEFMCDDCYSAGTKEKTVGWLVARINRGFDGEHPDYWQKDLDMGNKQLLTESDLKKLGITDPNLLGLSL